MTDFQNMQLSSTLLAHYESLSIVHRSDINALLTKLAEDKKIGFCVANARREEARYLVDRMNVDANELVFGATYVPLEATMRYIKRQSDCSDNREVRIPSRGEETGDLDIKFLPIWPLFLYPCQRMDTFRATFPSIPPLTIRVRAEREHVNFQILGCLWETIALITRLEKLWEILTTRSNYCSTEWEGWILNFISRKCFNNLSRRALSKNDPFKMSELQNTKNVYDKFNEGNENMFDLKVVFSRVDDKVVIIDVGQDDDVTNINGQLIVIIKGYGDLESVRSGVVFKRFFNGIAYELRVVSAVWEVEVQRSGRRYTDWDAFVYSRHDGKRHNDWWYFKRNNNISVQVDSVVDFQCQETLTLGYVCCDALSVAKYKRDFLTYIGGRNNIYCGVHNLPLIASTTRDNMCSRCGEKKEFFKCCNFDCKICLCKVCLDECDENVPNYVRESTDNANDEVDNNQVESSDDRSIDLGMSDDEEGSDSDEEYSFVSNDDSFDDDFDDFVVTTYDPDLEYGDDHDYVGSNDPIPTTNAAENALQISDARGQRPINRVSGHVILNQCGSLLSRRDHEIKGSSKHQFFLQKIHATSNAECIPLIYPEGVLFPSIFPFDDPDGFASVGCIPAPLLCRSMEQLGFESIPQHTRTRLTIPSCKFGF